jgi:hypothetical protein
MLAAWRDELTGLLRICFRWVEHVNKGLPAIRTASLVGAFIVVRPICPCGIDAGSRPSGIDQSIRISGAFWCTIGASWDFSSNAAPREALDVLVRIPLKIHAR